VGGGFINYAVCNFHCRIRQFRNSSLRSSGNQGGTFGDVTSSVARMTNMASSAFGADHMKYLKYASPYNFTALVLAAMLFLIFAYIGSPVAQS